MRKIDVDQGAELIISTLCSRGYEAYAVGGCVRDSLMNRIPYDWDICTSALPEEVKQTFEHCIDTGLKHGTVTVILNDRAYEVTTMRTEGIYNDMRHPSTVSFVSDIALDLKRRDFTINAMAYNPKNGLVDIFGGLKDIEGKTVRCVGDADCRFSEDALRIMRAIRFSSVLGFEIENKTSVSVIKNYPLLKNIAAERISSELLKLLCGSNVYNVLDKYRNVLFCIIPELLCTNECSQNTKHHKYDVYTHIIKSVSFAPNDELIRTVMLLHDIGKPLSKQTDADGTEHFKGHDIKSAEMAEEILCRLRLPKKFVLHVQKLIKYHDLRPEPEKRSVMRTVRKIGEDDLKLLLKIQRADTLAQSEYMRDEKLERIENIERLLEEISAEESCMKISGLDIRGGDLSEIGLCGEQIGAALNKLLDAVIDGKVKNRKKELIEYIIYGGE